MDVTFSPTDITRLRDQVTQIRADPRTAGLSEKAILQLALRQTFSAKKSQVMDVVPKGRGRMKKPPAEPPQEVKMEFNQVDGGSLIGDLGRAVVGNASKILAWIAPKDMSPAVKRTMVKNANKEITDIKVCRVPIVSVIEKFLRLVSSVPKEYDKIYHLYMLLTLSDGTVLRAERNQTLQLQPASQKDIDMKVSGEIPSEVKDPASIPVSIPSGVTLGKAMTSFISEAKKRNPTLGPWRYAAMSNEGNPSNNCQDMVLSWLKGMKASTPEVEKFVKQDIDKLLPEAGTKAQQGITDLAGAVGQHILGRGHEGGDPVTDINQRVRTRRMHVITDFHI